MTRVPLTKARVVRDHGSLTYYARLHPEVVASAVAEIMTAAGEEAVAALMASLKVKGRAPREHGDRLKRRGIPARELL